ncbi:MAG: tetratricopeptide repeat protein [Massilibacteroides sp.]|nr:tetratricopeptide repeat protein [Massilibacteroides sp.]MDD3063042.1 tetratricopeptide repeat protein [Massilibacteroides sp.]MDD4114181.1 tetratricopeptide repeat protein [Massilibacteroides sp.]MDD4660551.1 tetratricopeptide repeat protein [Massilibacteroides sp.]
MANFFSSLFSSPVKEEVVDGLTKSDRKKFDILKYDGVRAQRIGKLPYAIKCFTEALLIQEDMETMSYLVGAYTMVHEPENALDVLDRMLELEPDRMNTLFSRVSVLFLLNREEEVVRDCRHILSLEPSNALACYLLGKALKNKGEVEEAIDAVSEGIRLKENFSEAYLLRSELFLEKKEGTLALEDTDRVIANEGEEETAYLLRGKIHSFIQKKTEAEADFRNVLALNPFHEDAALALAELLEEMERWDEALVALDDLIELSPDLGKAYEKRAKIKKQRGDGQGAEEDEQKAKELSDSKTEQSGQADFSKLYEGGIF